jgi:hypothetical protein
MSEVAFVRPADDAAAADLSSWGDDLRQLAAQAGGVRITDRAGSSNTDRTTIDHLLESNPDHLFWFGHGRDDALIARGDAIVDTANVGALSGGALVAIACKAALSLGPLCTQNHGVRGFLGFDDYVGWPVQAPQPTRDAIVQGLACLLTEDHDLDCAATQLRNGFGRARLEYEANGALHGLSDGDAMTAWLFAKSNGGSVRVYGDSTTTLAAKSTEVG